MWKAILYKLAKALIIEVAEEILDIVRKSPEDTRATETLVKNKIKQL